MPYSIMIESTDIGHEACFVLFIRPSRLKQLRRFLSNAPQPTPEQIALSTANPRFDILCNILFASSLFRLGVLITYFTL